MKTDQKIRVVLLIDSLHAPAWVYRSIEQIKLLEGVRICGVLVCPAVIEKQVSKVIHHKLGELQSRLFDGDIGGPDYREKRDLTNLLGGDLVRSIGSTNSPGWANKMVAALRQVKADVVIKYTDDELPEVVLSGLKYGIWDHLFNAGAAHRRGYEGLWETLLSQPEVGSSLQISHRDFPRQALLRSFSCAHEASVYGTNNPNYWKSSSFASRALKRLMQRGGDAFFEGLASQPNQANSISQHNIDCPGAMQYAYLLAKKTACKLAKKFKYKRYFEQWLLYYSFKPDARLDSSNLIQMLPPKEVFWADPHIVVENERYYIFIEELPFATDKGYLSVIEMSQNGHYGSPVKILERDYHLSYPNVFQHEGQYYMIPETYDNGTIELYRCTRFPDQWEFVMNLMQGVRAVDTTLYYADDKWWLFANIQENPGASPHDELFLFYTESGDFQTTDWVAHPLNPVVSDVKNARPAGKIYEENGKVYRPAQNCSHHYGYAMNINEITCLNTEEYKEQIVKSIEPVWDKNVIATHTYAKAEKLTVLDGIFLRKK